MKIFLTHPREALANYYGERALGHLREVGEVVLNGTDRELGPAEIVERAADCNVIVSYRQTRGPAELLERLPALLAFCRCAIDIRNVDVEAASERGILVTQATAGFVNSVSEWIIGSMIALSRDVVPSAASFHDGRVPPALMGRELYGSTIGIIGYGQISRRLCQLANVFGMTILVHDPYVATTGKPYVQLSSLPALLARSDYVVCLAAATDETHNLMQARTFAQMKPSAFFLNASRGELVNDDDLLDALERGSIAGAALDVGRAPDQFPTARLAAHPRVIATPHVGGLTVPAIEHQAFDTVRQVAAIARGQVPQNAVNCERAFRFQQYVQNLKR